MTSQRQLEANRCNAQKSTGPRTTAGKHRSRRNAIRHGLTAETVIGVLEDPNDYRAFERAVVREYGPRNTIEKQLVFRLASLLWRLRRATAIETGLLHIQAEILNSGKAPTHVLPNMNEGSDIVGRIRGHAEDTPSWTSKNGPAFSLVQDAASNPHERSKIDVPADNSKTIARCFLRLANFENELLERVGRYEAALWRQYARTHISLTALRCVAPRSGENSSGGPTPNAPLRNG